MGGACRRCSSCPSQGQRGPLCPPSQGAASLPHVPPARGQRGPPMSSQSRGRETPRVPSAREQRGPPVFPQPGAERPPHVPPARAQRGSPVLGLPPWTRPRKLAHHLCSGAVPSVACQDRQAQPRQLAAPREPRSLGPSPVSEIRRLWVLAMSLPCRGWAKSPLKLILGSSDCTPAAGGRVGLPVTLGGCSGIIRSPDLRHPSSEARVLYLCLPTAPNGPQPSGRDGPPMPPTYSRVSAPFPSLVSLAGKLGFDLRWSHLIKNVSDSPAMRSNPVRAHFVGSTWGRERGQASPVGFSL